MKIKRLQFNPTTWSGVSALLVMTLCQGMALAEVSDQSQSNYFEKGRVAYIYNDGAPLREKPSTKAPAIKVLSVGEKITLDEEHSTFEDENTVNLSGVELPWLKVGTEDGKHGYLWAGNIAQTTVKQDLNNDGTEELVLTNRIARHIEHKTDYDSAIITTGIKTLEHNTVIDEQKFDTDYDETNGMQTTLYRPMGFNPNTAILKEEFAAEACGVVGGYVFFAWHDNHWIKGFQEDTYSDAGVVSDSVDFVFPEEKGGQPNAIKAIRTTESNFNEKTNQYTHKEKEIMLYIWEDGKFQSKKIAVVTPQKSKKAIKHK